MHEVNSEARCIGTKSCVKMDHMYFEWDKFIPTLEGHQIFWRRYLTMIIRGMTQNKMKVSHYQQMAVC